MATDDALRELTLDDIRGTPPLELEVLIEELEAAAANALDADGSTSLSLSRLLAVAHTCTGDNGVAATHARAALGVADAADAEMHFVLGVEAERRDAQDEALEQYEAAVDADPKCWRALFHTGKIALSFGWPADAVDYFQQVAEINPSHAPTQAFLAKLEEAAIDVQEWQDANAGAGGDAADDNDEPAPSELPDMPKEMRDFKL